MPLHCVIGHDFLPASRQFSDFLRRRYCIFRRPRRPLFHYEAAPTARTAVSFSAAACVTFRFQPPVFSEAKSRQAEGPAAPTLHTSAAASQPIRLLFHGCRLYAFAAHDLRYA